MHDDEHSHSILIEELELESEVYSTRETKLDNRNQVKI